jgi:hypothetical protein
VHTQSVADLPQQTIYQLSHIGGNGGTIVIPTGTIYYLNSVLDFAGCVGCDFQVEGLLPAPGVMGYLLDR